MKNRFLSVVLLFLFFIAACSSTPPKKKKKPKKVQKPFPYKLEKEIFIGSPLVRAAIWKDDDILAVADKKGLISIFSLPDVKLKKQIQSPRSGVFALVFVKDGDVVGQVSGGGRLLFFNCESGKREDYPLLQKLKGVMTAAFCEKTGFLGVGTVKGKLFMFSEKMEQVFTRKTGFKKLRYLHFNRNGKVLAYAGDGRAFSLFFMKTLKIRKKINTNGPVVSFAFSDSGKYLAVGTLFWKIYVYRLKNFKSIADAELDLNPVKTLAFQHSPESLLSGSGRVGGGILSIFGYPSYKLSKKLSLKKADEVIFCGFFNSRFVVVTADGRIVIYKKR